MVGIGDFLADPWTVRMIVSIVAGAVTGLVAVRLTFFLHNQRDLFKSVRAIRAELEHDIDQIEKLASLLQQDMSRQQIDLPIEVPAGTAIEIRYVLTLPSALNTSAFDQLRQSGRLLELDPDIRRPLFDLYDVIDRINRLRQHRERLHYNNVDHLHLVIDATELDVEPGAKATEDDLTADMRQQLETIRRLRRAMNGINTSILRLIASICSPTLREELGVQGYDDATERTQERENSGVRGDDGDRPPDIESVIDALEAIEEDSFWSRFV